MKNFQIIVCIVVCTFVFHYFICYQVAYAAETPGDSVDCSDVSIDFTDDETLTRAERLRLMDKAFTESLNKFELCRLAREMAKKAADAAATGTGNSNGGGNKAENGSGDLEGQDGGTPTGQSVASSTMSGTESVKEYTPTEGIEVVEPATVQGAQNIEEAGSRKNGNTTMSNGKLPEDIPSADNDDALAAQIRYAAEHETDPAKKEQLWNEYRKYRGLPQKK